MDLSKELEELKVIVDAVVGEVGRLREALAKNCSAEEKMAAAAEVVDSLEQKLASVLPLAGSSTVRE